MCARDGEKIKANALHNNVQYSTGVPYFAVVPR